jgi:BolA protein
MSGHSRPTHPLEPGRARWLEAALRKGFDPVHLVVEDESARHAGHAGAAGGGGHFRAVIVSAAFRGQSQLARQRAVFALLGEHTTIHALALQTLTPEEWEAEVGGRGTGAGKR